MPNPTVSERVAHKSKDAAGITEPRLYKVVFINDDVTPIEFALSVIMRIFDHAQAVATRLVMEIDRTGSAVAGIFPYDIAATKVAEATQLSRAAGFPLRCDLEPEAGTETWQP